MSKVIDIIRNELSVTMGLCGIDAIAEIDDHMVAFQAGSLVEWI